MDRKLKTFIDRTYREPYNLFSNNCFHKSRRIIKEARKLGLRADLIFCGSIVTVKKWRNFRILGVHFYAMVEGEKVDVALNPQREREYCKNEELILFMLINLSKVGGLGKANDI